MTPPLSSRRRSKTPPPGETGQEGLYLRSLSDRQVIVNIKLRDGETVRGWIEYFDDSMLRLTREGQPNLFIYKHQIRTITEVGRRRTRPLRDCGRAGFGGDGIGRGGAVTGAAEAAIQTGFVFVPQAAEIAREAGARLREFFAQGVETEYKGDVDLVTVADRTVGKADPRAAGRGLSGARNLRRRGHARAAGGRVPLVRGPAGRDHQLCPRVSAVLRLAWAWSSGRKGLAPDAGRNAGGRGHLRSHAGRALRRRARARRAAERQADAGFAHAGAGRGAGRHRLSQPQAPREPEHPLLPGVHVALARGAAGRLGRARSGVRCLPAAWTASGSSISIPGTRLRAFCWWKRRAGA